MRIYDNESEVLNLGNTYSRLFENMFFSIRELFFSTVDGVSDEETKTIRV